MTILFSIALTVCSLFFILDIIIYSVIHNDREEAGGTMIVAINMIPLIFAIVVLSLAIGYAK